MDNKILVSVCCLTYNHEKYIRKTLEGFVSQKTNFKYEVFVHDDASTDKTAEIIKEYELKYPYIIKPIYQTENQYSKGVKITAKFIFPIMEGKYVAYCEGDDFWTNENKLQVQVDFLEKNPKYSACVHQTMIYNSRKNKYIGYINNHKKNYDITFEEVIYNGGTAYQTSSLMMRREFCFNRPKFFEYAKGCGDWSLSIYLVLSGKVRFLSYCMSTYRLFSGPISWTSKNDTETKKDIDYCRINYENFVSLLMEVKNVAPECYWEEIDRSILFRKYIFFKNTGDFKSIRKKPYKQFLKEETFKRKIYYFFKAYLPRFAKLMEKFI